MAAPRRLWVRVPRGILALLFFLAFGVGGLLLGCLFFPPLTLFRARRAMRALVRASYRLFVWAAHVTGLFRVVLSPEDRARFDAMRGCEKASFCVYTPGEKRGGNWWLTICSVIVFGRIREITDHARAIEISRELSRKFTDDEDYIEQEVRSSGAGVLCFALEIEAMTGKTVEER